MKSKLYLLVLFVLVGGMLLSACGGAATQPADIYAYGGAATEAPAAMEAPAMANEFVVGQSADAMVDVAKQDPNAPVPENASYASSHMIIKNADVRLQVEDTDVAIDRATQAIGDLGGYIVSSRVWYQDYYDGIETKNYKYATLTIGIPVDQFERMLSRLRGLSVKVLDETASGDDVTDQFVDLQSQLTNLEATRERIKSFLDDAKTVDEALRINQELSSIESQIEAIKGQMNYLQDRSAYSTITVNFEPVLPEVKPQPTPTPIAWNPGETLGNATKTLTSAYQGIVELLIWLFVVFLPIVAPPVLILWGIWKLFSRKIKS
jgi:ABC-type phosphate transport system auxiliary subunit